MGSMHKDEVELPTCASLPPDVLNNILQHLGRSPKYAHNFALTCKAVHDAVVHCDGFWATAHRSTWGSGVMRGRKCIDSWKESVMLARKMQTRPSCAEVAVATGGPCYAVMAPVATDTLPDGSRVVHAAAAVGRRMWWLSTGGVDSCGPPLLQSSHPVDQGHVEAILPLPHSSHPACPTCPGAPPPYASASTDRTVKIWAPSAAYLAEQEERLAAAGGCDGGGYGGSRGGRGAARRTMTQHGGLTPIKTLRHHTESVHCLEIVHLPGARVLLASGSADKTVQLSTLAPLLPSPPSLGRAGVLRGHERAVRCMVALHGAPPPQQALPPDPDSDSDLLHAERAPSACSRSRHHHDAAHVGRDGGPILLASGGNDAKVKLWDISRAGEVQGHQPGTIRQHLGISGGRGGGGAACVAGWRLLEPCVQLLQACGPCTDAPGAAAAQQLLVAVQSRRLDVLDPRQQLPVCGIAGVQQAHTGGGRAGSSGSGGAACVWGSRLQAATCGHLLAHTWRRGVRVYDLRYMSHSRQGTPEAPGSSSTFRPLYSLKPLPPGPMGMLTMDADKVVAVSLLPAHRRGRARRECGGMECVGGSWEPLGPVWAWSTATGQLLGSFSTRLHSTGCPQGMGVGGAGGGGGGHVTAQGGDAGASGSHPVAAATVDAAAGSEVGHDLSHVGEPRRSSGGNGTWSEEEGSLSDDGSSCEGSDGGSDVCDQEVGEPPCALAMKGCAVAMLLPSGRFVVRDYACGQLFGGGGVRAGSGVCVDSAGEESCSDGDGGMRGSGSKFWA